MTGFPFDAVFWDIDGTLADSEPVHERSFYDVCGALGLPLPEDFKDQILGFSEEAAHQWLVDHAGLGLGLRAWMGRRQDAYMARIDEVVAHPDATAVWRSLVDLRVTLATVSNSHRRIVDANLDRLGLFGRYESIAREDVARGKPAPDPYLLAAERLGVAPARVAVIEDSATGLAAGRAAGMSVFMMPHFIGDADGSWRPLSALLSLTLAE